MKQAPKALQGADRLRGEIPQLCGIDEGRDGLIIAPALSLPVAFTIPERAYLLMVRQFLVFAQ